MKGIFNMVGNTAAHSIWSVADGETLIPILTTINGAGEARNTRLAMDDSADAMQYGHRKLEQHEEDTVGAVFVTDGYITLDSGKTDALILEVRAYSGATAKCRMIIPYRAASSAKGFAIHRPQLIEFENIDQGELAPLMEAFFDGVDGHKQGGEVWQRYYIDQADPDDSVTSPSDFSAEQWEQMLDAPYLVFFLVAAADGTVDKKEIKALGKVLSASAKYHSDLLHRLVTNSISQLPQFIRRLANGGVDYFTELEQIRTIVEAKFPPEDARGFKVALLNLGKDIAEASGGFLGLGDKISNAEKAALVAIITCLKIELDS